MGFKTSCIVSFSMFVMVLLISGCWRSFGEDLEVACEGNQTCASGLECSINGSCVCSSNSCSGCCSPDGLVCHDGQQDNACGPPGGTCRICGDTEECINHECVRSITCWNEGGCEREGQTICGSDNASFFVCHQNDEGCFVPGESVTCGPYEVCRGGECICDNPCNEPRVHCSGSSFIECKFDDLSGCWYRMKGTCADGEICNDSGGEICLSICDHGGCEPQQYGLSQCLDRHVLGTCGEDLSLGCWTWASEVYECGAGHPGYYCEGSDCMECPMTTAYEDACHASEAYTNRCSANTLNVLEICDAHHAHPDGCFYWFEDEPCPEGSYCDDDEGACLGCPIDCTPGDVSCYWEYPEMIFECVLNEHGCPDWSGDYCPDATPQCMSRPWVENSAECFEGCSDECSEEELGNCRVLDETSREAQFCEEFVVPDGSSCFMWVEGRCGSLTACYEESCEPLACESHGGVRGAIARACASSSGTELGVCADIDGIIARYYCQSYVFRGEDCFVLIRGEICKGSLEDCAAEIDCILPVTGSPP